MRKNVNVAFVTKYLIDHECLKWTKKCMKDRLKNVESVVSS